LPEPEEPRIPSKKGNFKSILFHLNKMLLQTANKMEFSDWFIDSAILYHQNGSIPTNLTENQIIRFKTRANRFQLINDKLYARIKSKTLNVTKHQVQIVAPRDRDQVLSEMYKDTEQTRNGRDSFYTKVAMKYLNISRRYVQEFLRKQVNYQLHLQQPREKTLKPESVTEVGEKFQIDLIDMTKFVGYNARKGWIVTCIDVFSKYAFARSITTKKAEKVLEALEDILTENYGILGRDPKVIHSDNGSEFVAKIYKDFLKSRGIEIFYGQTYSAQQQGTIERFNRTLKSLIYSYITTRQGQSYAQRYYDKLQDFVKNYNTSIHSSIKARPIDIHKSSRQNVKQVKLVEKKIEKFVDESKELPVLLPHDKVRLHILTLGEERKKKLFAKKVAPQWSVEIYEIVRRFHLNDPSKKKKYRVKMVVDENGNQVDQVVERLFYRQDLQKII
jgi:hypothetical protein